MDMEGTEEFVGSSPNNEMIQIVKGKRTKRQRPYSPCGVTTMTSSSSSASGVHVIGGDEGGGGGGVDYGSFSSPTTAFYDSTEEEEDMANCLILLAQGDGPRQNINAEGNIKTQPFAGRKLVDLATTSGNKSGPSSEAFYVYKCKTCNRTFPSFQALGGHRASHKKPKTLVDEKKPPSPTPPPPVPPRPTHEDSEETLQAQIKSIPQISLHPNSNNNKGLSFNGNKSKIHECSICGSEFTSGQALGGHMRRHRAAAIASTAGQMVGLGGIDHQTSATTSSTNEIKPIRNILELDLNLPAPLEDDHRDTKFQFTQTQQTLVLSTPALVDCHY